jgi:hypothetical protein
MPTMKQFTTRYGVRANTIRRWSGTFAQHLTDGANPPKGKRRHYSIEDADVIDLVATMRAEDAETGEILNALEAGKRGQWPRDDTDTAEDAPGSSASELTGKDKLIAELSHRLGVVEGKLELMTEWHEQWQDRAQIAEGKLLLLEAPESPQAADKQDTAPTESTQSETPPQDEKMGFWARFFGRGK